LELVAEVGDLTFADTSSGMLDQVALKIADRSLTNASTLNLSHHPLPQGFDLVFSLMVLHHIDDARAQVEALAGALAPEGTLCLGDLDREDGSFHAPEVVPHNGFLRPTIEGWLQESGLTVTDTCTGFVNRKLIAGQEREFPMFLITARRAPVAAV
jgi:SAM-dependent methyltransferase